jgi:ketosteroid isomerase-like protein
MKEKAMNPVLWISVFVVALLAEPSVTQAQTRADADVATTISNLENDGVKADLAGDPAFYHKVLAEDWTRGDSDGTYYTKAELLRLMADTKNFKTNSEKLSELKVRVYGDTAVATYKDTYDILIMGEHRAHTIIATDTFAKMGDEWKQVASHGAEAK